MSFGIRIANFIGLLLFGEPIRPIQFPSENWALSNPLFEITANAERMILTIRDHRYPRLKGTLTITLAFGQTMVRWRTKASGGGMVARGLVRATDDGYLRGPSLLGRLQCNQDELRMIGRFLEKQVRPDRDEADPLLVTVPVGPLRPSGRLSGEVSPQE